MSEATGGAGGFALQFTLDPTILLSSSGALNPFRQLARVETTTPSSSQKRRAQSAT
jgi:hypothetical protein